MFPTVRCLTVTELNSYIKNLMDSDELLSNVWVKGEITNFKEAISGHLYFGLKDSSAVLKCVMFSSAARKLLFKPENGMKVMVQGYVSIYTRNGEYQLYIRELHTMGLGDLHIAFEQLKKKLELKGLFEMSHKRTIPILPSKIGIVTSITGAVLHDIITVARRRNPNIELIIAPASVQGAEAPEEIAKAINRLNQLTALDVIIVARGGGSLEELWAFNTEKVAHAIYDSVVPVVSAVGHETDVTIADLVADMRAPTPSAAAEMLVPSLQQLKEKLHKQIVKLQHNMNAIIETNKLKIGYIAKSKVMRNPIVNLDQFKQFLDYASNRLENRMQNLVAQYQKELQKYAKQLHALSPLAILQRGYAICKTHDDKYIYETSQVEIGNVIKVILKEDSLVCKVMGKERC
ncbi:MAG: exodeoxyribonuclease VII large subunit [Zhaonellaceae bacterium]|jgi:exodeoxyribonuclease VII large subunit|nr:exodeoxyribonuclease VII large subunit [Clostridia bacterium]